MSENEKYDLFDNLAREKILGKMLKVLETP
jgi:hypothetical protein